MDANAQRAVYDQYRSRLMGLCRRYARNRDDAADILQDSFVKIFSKIGQVESSLKFESWMKSIAVRTAIDHYHKHKRIDLQSHSDGFEHVVDLDYAKILDTISDEYLLKVINELPEGCRMIFNLFEVEGYSHAEIAELLGVSEGTSRSQLHHAKFLLKEKLVRMGVKRYEKFA